MSSEIRTWQSRLGSKLDKQKRRLIDNSIKMMGTTSDILRIRNILTKQLDIESRVIEATIVANVVFPPLINIPSRKLVLAPPGSNNLPSMDSLFITDAFPIELIVPQGARIQRDDLIFRVLWDPNVEMANCLVLQAKDTLGTYGSNSLLWERLFCTYYDEVLPQPIIDIIIKTTNRRLALTW
jgi:hypothetical protein